jgi:hypothetical protein
MRFFAWLIRDNAQPRLQRAVVLPDSPKLPASST